MFSHLLSKLPASRAADWGCKVTVCIGALCEGRKVIVAASDMLATLGTVASDVAVWKNDVLFPRWIMMTAGDDTEHIDYILTRARQLLHRKMEYKTAQEVASKLAQSYAERLQTQIEATVLSRHRFTPNTFRDMGKKKLTASVFNRLVARIAEVKIKLSFLVCGFDRDRNGQILGIDRENAPVSYTKLGYWAIGDGAPMALSSLGFFNHQVKLSGRLSLGQCVYQVCAAKFMSEATKTVGRQSFIAVYGPSDGQVRFLFQGDQEKIRMAWEKEGAPRVPEKIVSEIPQMLYSPDDPDFKDKEEKTLKELFEMAKANPSILQR